MKIIIPVIIILGSIYLYADVNTGKIESEMKTIDKNESKNMEKILKRKGKLESELDGLQNSYNTRSITEENIKVKAQSGWNRDEYKKILKKYETVQDKEKNIITKKNKELNTINKGISIINNKAGNINQEVAE